MPPLTRLISPTIASIKPSRATWAVKSGTLAMSTGAAETDTQAADTASTSGVTVSSLEQTLKDKLGAEHVDIEDMSGGCGQAFNARIVSRQFEAKNTLARHRLVNSALKTEIAAIHAWTPKCFTPEEWAKKHNEAGS
ncbi:MAG: hypothetical protein Q9169_000592 [Polycauliona sp. 2 TL-2023]